MTDMTFGECLSSMLSILDISMNRLAKAINVDNSLVNRWIHCKRIPAYNTDHIENIAEYLSCNFHNSIQTNRLDTLFYDICKNNAAAVSIKDKIKMSLSECQGYSIERRKKECIKANNTGATSELNQNSSYHRNIIPKEILSLSSDDKIFFGNSNTLSLCVDLLGSALTSQNSNVNTIYITYRNYLETESAETIKLINKFRIQLLRVANRGINICFLIKLDSNIKRILDFIKFIYPVLLTGRLVIYYNTKYGIIDSDHEICVVPGIGALSCLPNSEDSHKKCGFLLKSSHAVNVFNDYFKMLIKLESKELIRYYSQDTAIKYYSNLVEAQENIGSCFLYRTCPHPFMMPAALYKNILERKKLPQKDIYCSVKIFEMHMNTLKKNICLYEYYDACSVKVFTDLITNRKFPVLINGIIETVILNADDVLEIIKNIIYTIKSFENYKFILMQDTNLSGYDNCCVFIKEKLVLFYEMHSNSSNVPETMLSVNEPMVVCAAEKYFMEKYEQIAPINKDKHEIINFLKKQMSLLKK